mmetsp:Transcript_48609/g.125312  ORF Transcript_48609/g.125312 Transcript_48609/m.125312 type:complete len:356 (+) Transcript_48609:1465-2532(+)
MPLRARRGEAERGVVTPDVGLWLSEQTPVSLHRDAPDYGHVGALRLQMAPAARRQVHAEGWVRLGRACEATGEAAGVPGRPQLLLILLLLQAPGRGPRRHNLQRVDEPVRDLGLAHERAAGAFLQGIAHLPGVIRVPGRIMRDGEARGRRVVDARDLRVAALPVLLRHWPALHHLPGGGHALVDKVGGVRPGDDLLHVLLPLWGAPVGVWQLTRKPNEAHLRVDQGGSRPAHVLAASAVQLNRLALARAAFVAQLNVPDDLISLRLAPVQQAPCVVIGQVADIHLVGRPHVLEDLELLADLLHVALVVALWEHLRQAAVDAYHHARPDHEANGQQAEEDEAGPPTGPEAVVQHLH